MPGIFISHSSGDNAAAETLRDALAARGYEGTFLDFHPEVGIPAGRNWEQELYRQLRRCRALVFLGSTQSAASRWCFAELALARSMGKPIFPVRIAADVRHPLVDDVQWTDVSADPADGYERLWRGLREQGLDPRDVFAWDGMRSPYPGLASFDEGDAAVFFGRSEEVQELFERVNNSLSAGGERFVAVVGPSGSGKSSLIRAGLVPRLRRAGGRWLVARPFTPQDDPVQMMARSLSHAFASVGQPVEWRDLRSRLMAGGGALVEMARDLLDAAGNERGVVMIVVDQAEELVTLCGAESRAAFARIILDALDGVDVLRVVASLRSEFLSDALRQTELAPLVHQPYLVAPLPRAQLAATVVGPAEVAGAALAPGLVERIVEDTGGGDALPLLAFTMERLWQRALTRPDRRIDEDDYQAVGGVEGALRQRADAVSESLAKAGLEPVIMPALLGLVALDRGTAPTRRHVRLASLTDHEERVVRAFIEARLLATEGSADDAEVHVAHEALFRAWQPLADAIEAHRDELRQRSRLERDARDWLDAGRPEAYLLQGERLDAALRFEHQNHDPGPLREFVDASRALRERVLGREADLVGNRIIADHEDDPERAILVALAAMDAYGRRPRLELALAYAVDASAARARFPVDAWIHSATFSPDGRAIAIGGGGGRIIMLDAATGETLWRRDAITPYSLDEDVHGLDFTHSGAHLVVRRRHAASLVILDAGSGDEVTVLDAGGSITAACVAEPNCVVAAAEDGLLRRWSAEPPFSALAPARARIPFPANCIAVSHDGERIAVGCTDRQVYLLNASDDERQVRPLLRHDDTITDVAFSPDAAFVASTGLDGRLRVQDLGADELRWDVETGTWTWAVRWSDDGKRILTVDERHGLRAWDAASGASEGALATRDAASRVLAAAPDGRRVATAWNDRDTHALRVWAVGREERRLRVRVGNAFSQARFAGDDRYLVSRSTDFPSELAVRDAATGEKLHAAALTRDIGRELAVAHDGRVVAITQGDSVSVRSVPELEVVRELAVENCGHVVFARHASDVLFLSTTSGDVIRWDGSSAETVLQVGEFYAGSLDITPDGRHILVAGGRRFSLYEIDSGDELFRQDADGTGNLLAAAAPDGTCIAVAQGSVLRTLALDGSVIIDFAWGKYNRESAWAPAVGQIAFSPDSRRLATSSAEGWVYIWDVATGELVRLVKIDREPLKDMAFSADGQALVVCTATWEGEYDSTGYAEIWSCPDLDHLLALADRRSFRSVTADERAQYGLPGTRAAPSVASLFHLET